MPDAT
ncbi:hypothetical protein ECTW14313_0377, partial [Escherichia coli O157:H7 str. TW14313]